MARSLHNLLADTEGAGQLMAHAGLLLKLSHLYSEIVPKHFLLASGIANYKEKTATVVIHADNGAVAVKLRQMIPSLVSEFAQRGLKCSGVQVKVQTRNLPQPSTQIVQKTFSEQARLSLVSLMNSLPQGATLKGALAQLLARAPEND